MYKSEIKVGIMVAVLVIASVISSTYYQYTKTEINNANITKHSICMDQCQNSSSNLSSTHHRENSQTTFMWTNEYIPATLSIIFVCMSIFSSLWLQ